MNTLINNYITKLNKKQLDEIASYKSISDCASSYYRENKERIKASHQIRISNKTLKFFGVQVSKHITKDSNFKNFEELFKKVKKIAGSVKGIGNLTIYDTALRIGFYLSNQVFPKDFVYLSRGTKEGAEALLGRKVKNAENVEVFRKYFNELDSRQIENILCIEKEYFKRLVYVCQSKNTFIRITADFGYITNQLTKFDISYNETGAIFLKEITRSPKNINEIIKKIEEEFIDISNEDLRADFISFVTELEEKGFLLLGKLISETLSSDITFTYNIEKPRTILYDFSQKSKNDDAVDDTLVFFLEEAQRNPKLSAIQFELTSRCNERCIHCYIPNSKKDKGSDMPTSKIKSIIDEFSRLGGLHITISGGEPMLHKDFLKILHFCREKDMKISVLSNLTLLKDSDIPAIKKLNLYLIQTSLYSMDPQIHDAITTIKGSFYKTKMAIEKLYHADIPVQISCPVMKLNYKCFKNVLKYANSLKIKANTDFLMMGQADFDTSNLSCRLSISDTEKLLKDILLIDFDYSEITLRQEPISNQIIKDLERFKKQPICGVGLDNCCITANGDVYPCAGWQGMILGNVNRNSLEEIWTSSSKINELRQITQASFPKCLECDARDYCSMCLVRNYNENHGDMFKINDHFCKVAFLNKKVVEDYHKQKII
jgi:radical SAM protein with 4Fe4S-binding SPASM domain